LARKASALRARARVRTDDPHLVGAHVAQTLAEAAETGQRPLLAVFVEQPFLIQPGSQAHHFSEPIDDRRLAMLIARDDHVEAVRAEIYRGHDLRRITAGQ
jgi:hypothetical protein